MRVAQTLLLPLVLAALWSPGVDAHEAAAASCIDTDDIEACMESLGFGCSRRPSPQTSIGAFELRCSIPLPDGRTYAVQLLNDTDAWSIGREHSYHPESAPHNLEPLRDSNSILNTYIHEQMGNMTLQYSGAQETPRRVQIQFEVRSGSSGESVGVMALCGTVLAEEPDDWLENHLIQSCEPLLQRVIVRLAQQDNSGPYRVFGMNDISWISSNATVGQDIDALLVEGRYLFSPGHQPCRFISHCCSRDGSTYLESCREPTAEERDAISSCLDHGLQIRNERFRKCLREQNVRVGCELQADGSSLCY